jgi:hypothetical protein
MVIGATFTGIGIACTAKAANEDSIVVERHALAGHDFIGCYDPGTGWDDESASVTARSFRAELLQRNLLKDGKVHLPGILPVLFNRIKQNKLNVKLLTEVVSITPTAEGYTVQLFNASGLHEIDVERIIDTTTQGLLLPKGSPSITAKRINAMIQCKESEQPLPDLVPYGARLVDGLFPGETIMKLELDLDDDWPAARHKLHRFWKTRPEPLQAWTFTTVADHFEFTVPESPTDCGHPSKLWLPSCGYPNLLHALDVGCLFKEGGCLHDSISN